MGSESSESQSGSTIPPDRTEGWGFPGLARKAHYFVDSMSLCRRWGLYQGLLSADDGRPSPDDCVECRRELAKRSAK